MNPVPDPTEPTLPIRTKCHMSDSALFCIVCTVSVASSDLCKLIGGKKAFKGSVQPCNLIAAHTIPATPLARLLRKSPKRELNPSLTASSGLVTLGFDGTARLGWCGVAILSCSASSWVMGSLEVDAKAFEFRQPHFDFAIAKSGVQIYSKKPRS